MKKFFQNLFFLKKHHNWTVAASSCCGQRHENQDNYLIIEPKDWVAYAYFIKEQNATWMTIENWPPDYIRLAIADGMGGHPLGRAISEAAIAELMKLPPQSSPELMYSSILSLHNTLQSRFFSTIQKSPGTTLIVADINRLTGKGVLLHIGDSRGFLFHRNKWRVLTHDHTYSEFALRDGELSRKKYNIIKNMTTYCIAQAFGYGSTGIIRGKDGKKSLQYNPNIRIDRVHELPLLLTNHADVFSFNLCKKDILLLATDGLWSAGPDNLWHGFTAQELLSWAGAEQLVEKTIDYGADDNITIVVCGASINVSGKKQG
jgi:serine/threonine protein phosphatase PrpC